MKSSKKTASIYKINQIYICKKRRNCVEEISENLEGYSSCTSRRTLQDETIFAKALIRTQKLVLMMPRTSLGKDAKTARQTDFGNGTEAACRTK